MSEMLNREDEQALEKTILRIHEQGWGIAFGLVFGLGLFFATIWLVVRGGPNVGQHLGLLGMYLPGYQVSYLGGFIGLVYGFVIGYGVGRLIATAYNRMTSGMH
jgi:hypothetical protein